MRYGHRVPSSRGCRDGDVADTDQSAPRALSHINGTNVDGTARQAAAPAARRTSDASQRSTRMDAPPTAPTARQHSDRFGLSRRLRDDGVAAFPLRYRIAAGRTSVGSRGNLIAAFRTRDQCHAPPRGVWFKLEIWSGIGSWLHYLIPQTRLQRLRVLPNLA